MCGACEVYRELQPSVEAYETIRGSLNMRPEGASPDEVVAEVGKIFGESLRFRLDQAGIEHRDNEAAELVDLRAKVMHLKAKLKEQQDITAGYVKHLHKAEKKIKDALDMAARRWSEWGDRAMSVWNILEPDGPENNL